GQAGQGPRSSDQQIQKRPDFSVAVHESVVCRFYGASGEEIISIGADVHRMTEPLMPRQRKPNDLSRSLTALDMDATLIAVVELSFSRPSRASRRKRRTILRSRRRAVRRGTSQRTTL